MYSTIDRSRSPFYGVRQERALGVLDGTMEHSSQLPQQQQQQQQQQHQQQQSHQPTALSPVPWQADEGADISTTSFSDIIEGLPTAVRSKLGPLRTIRRSVSIRGWVSYFYDISNGCMTSTVAHHQEQRSGSHHTLVSSTSTVGVHHPQQQMNSGQKRRRASATRTLSDPARSCGKNTPPMETGSEMVAYEAEPEAMSGIDRFCGVQGQQLVTHALSSTDDQNQRRAYLQGLAWLLQGLPQDLDNRERLELEHAMGQVPDVRRRMIEARRADAIRQRSFIHHSVAQLIVPLQLMWAYLIALMVQAVQLERKHKFIGQMVKYAGELGYMAGKKGLKLSEAIYNNGGERVCAWLVALTMYVASEVTKGINDGMRESLVGAQEDAYR